MDQNRIDQIRQELSMDRFEEHSELISDLITELADLRQQLARARQQTVDQEYNTPGIDDESFGPEKLELEPWWWREAYEMPSQSDIEHETADTFRLERDMYKENAEVLATELAALRQQRDALAEIVSELLEIWDDYEMLPALDAEMQERATALAAATEAGAGA